MTSKRLFILPLLLCLCAQAPAVEKLSLYALFKGKAILMVDGKRRVLVEQQTSPEGVTLIRTDTETEVAEVEIEGQREILKLGVVSAPTASGSSMASTVLWADPSGHFFATGSVNGIAVTFLVDTGATSIAMNSAAAARIGLDYRSLGKQGLATTASGVVPLYYLKLDTVKVGEIVLRNIDAGVIEGPFPTDILLGMSFLGRLNMKREGNKMELTRRY